VIPVAEPLADDSDDDRPADGVLELETWAALAVAALFTAAFAVALPPSQAVAVALATLGGAVVLFSALEVLTRWVQRVDLDRIPFPTDERAQTSPRSTAKEAAAIVGSVGLVGLVERYGVGGVLYQFFLTLIGAIQDVGGTFLAPLGAFSDGLASIVSAGFPARIINAAADFPAYSITEGQWNFFGPLTFAVGIAAVLLGLYLFFLVAQRINFSPLAVLYNRRR